MSLGQKCGNARGDDRPDVRHLLQGLAIGGKQRIQITEMASQIARRRLTDIADAERKNEAGQRRLLAFFDGRDQILRRFLGHALEAGQRFDRQSI